MCWARWQWRPGCHQCYSGATLVGPIRQHQILRLQQKKVKHLVACWTRLDLWTDLSTWVVGRGKYENEKQQPTHFGSNSLLSGWACLLIMSCCKAAYLPVLTINAARCSLSVPQNIALCRAVTGTGLMISPHIKYYLMSLKIVFKLARPKYNSSQM